MYYCWRPEIIDNLGIELLAAEFPAHPWNSRIHMQSLIQAQICLASVSLWHTVLRPMSLKLLQFTPVLMSLQQPGSCFTSFASCGLWCTQHGSIRLGGQLHFTLIWETKENSTQGFHFGSCPFFFRPCSPVLSCPESTSCSYFQVWRCLHYRFRITFGTMLIHLLSSSEFNWSPHRIGTVIISVMILCRLLFS